MNIVLRIAVAAVLVLSAFVPAAEVRAGDGGSSAPVAKTPAEVDGVVLDDGRQIEGTFEEKANQRWEITPKGGGAPLTVWVTQIVVAEKGGEVEQRGEEADAARVWRAPLRAAYFDALEAVFADCAAASLVDRARAVIQAMKEAGAAAPRLAKLAASLEGRTPGANPDAEKQAAEKQDAARAALIAGLERGIAWCSKRGFPTAATSMASEIGRLDTKRKSDVETRAKSLMPDGFFFKEAPDAVALWMKWADVLLPASAHFVDKADEDVWGLLENAPWTDGATLCFRTSNVLLFIRDMDPAVCAKALRLAEGTVRALQVFLHEGEPDVVSNDLSRLEIRIHKNRADYLAEKPARGKQADEWSAGYFSPLHRVSHFYIDHSRGKKGAPDLEELTRVLTHEFTHHYMTARWAARFITARGATEMSGGPGFWVVEGMAEFVQNQSHRVDESDPRFDDDFVLGNDTTAAARKAGVKSTYLAMEKFIDMTQGDFQALSDAPLGMVKLRHSPGTQGFSERNLWYDQAGALSYFFLQKKGPEMRQKFVKYVADHYVGVSHKPAWSYFGYPSAQALDDDFLAFLRTVSD